MCAYVVNTHRSSSSLTNSTHHYELTFICEFFGWFFLDRPNRCDCG